MTHELSTGLLPVETNRDVISQSIVFLTSSAFCTFLSQI